jgi:hypothetical protein
MRQKYAVSTTTQQQGCCGICEGSMRSAVVSFRDLKVWQLGMDLVVTLLTEIEVAKEVRISVC